jgi:hypothetical protein
MSEYAQELSLQAETGDCSGECRGCKETCWVRQGDNYMSCYRSGYCIDRSCDDCGCGEEN